MNNAGSNTHKPRAIEPANFRAQATGIGQSTRASRMTGAARAAQVVAQGPDASIRLAPAAEGFPPPAADSLGLPMSAQGPFDLVYQTKINGR